MDRIANVKRQVSLERWKSIIAECQSSGMPVYRWCKENGICEQTYYKKLKLLREQELDKLPLSLAPALEEKPAVFKKLEVTTPVPNTQAAVIIRLNGATVEINEGTSQQTIQAVLLALQSVC